MQQRIIIESVYSHPNTHQVSMSELLFLTVHICHLHVGLATPSSSAILDFVVKMGVGGAAVPDLFVQILL